MKTKYFLVFLVLLLSQISGNYANAQKCLSFDYDADGNRIKRYVHNNCVEMKDNIEIDDNEEITEISVYPNPTEGILKIIMPENFTHEKSFCHIYDLNGVLIMEMCVTDETIIDIGNMPSGIYLMKIISGDETFSKIILKH